MAATKNLDDVIQQLVETNQQLIDKKIDLGIAKQISNSTQVLINGARLQFDLFKVTGKTSAFIEKKSSIDELKEIAAEAAKLNKGSDNFDTVEDKRPFSLNGER